MLRNVRQVAALVLAAAVAVAQGCASDDVIFNPSTSSTGGGQTGGGGAADGGGGTSNGGGDPGGGGEGGAPPNCGDGVAQTDEGEDCDGDDLAGQDCTAEGFSNPAGLACDAACSFDISGCMPTCDGQLLEPGEDCDGDDLDGHGCQELGYSNPAGMSCTEACELSSEGCAPTCDGVLLEPDETCDGNDLGGADCTMFGFSSPAGLGCDGCQLDSSGCMPTCDGQLLEPGEACDGNDLGGADCTAFGYVNPAGLACDNGCQPSPTGCMAVCGNGITEPTEDCDDQNGNPNDGCDNCILVGGTTCANAVQVSLGLGTQALNGSTVGGGQHATTQCTGEDGSPDRVYAVTAQAAGFLTASLPRPLTNFNAILYTLTDCLNPGSGIWCADNSSNLEPNGGETLSIAVFQGQTVYVVVDGSNGQSGNYQLVLDLSVGTCADPVPMPIWQAQPSSGLGSTVGKPNNHSAGMLCGGGFSGEVVYEVTPQFSGNIDVRLPDAATNYDASISARSVCADQATQLACEHDQFGDDNITVQGTVGVPFYVLVDGFNGSTGSYRLRLDPP
jgi:cysteine-rich repeat protein